MRLASIRDGVLHSCQVVKPIVCAVEPQSAEPRIQGGVQMRSNHSDKGGFPSGRKSPTVFSNRPLNTTLAPAFLPQASNVTSRKFIRLLFCPDHARSSFDPGTLRCRQQVSRETYSGQSAAACRAFVTRDTNHSSPSIPTLILTRSSTNPYSAAHASSL